MVCFKKGKECVKKIEEDDKIQRRRTGSDKEGEAVESVENEEHGFYDGIDEIGNLRQKEKAKREEEKKMGDGKNEDLGKRGKEVEASFIYPCRHQGEGEDKKRKGKFTLFLFLRLEGKIEEKGERIIEALTQQ